MDRPTNEVSLPISKMVAEVFTYYLRGERKAIEAIMLDSVNWKTSGKDGKPQMEGVDTSYRAKMEDKAVTLAIHKLTKLNKEPVKVTTEVLDNLPDEDFKALQDALPSQRQKKK